MNQSSVLEVKIIITMFSTGAITQPDSYGAIQREIINALCTGLYRFCGDLRCVLMFLEAVAWLNN